MYSCCIIEDQPPAQRILRSYIADVETLQLKGTYANPIKALEYFSSELVDILYLDIHLPKISGLHFLKKLEVRPKVILTTAFADYALESYELDVIDYLLKPFAFERFAQATHRAIDQINLERASPIKEGEDSDHRIFIKVGTEYIQVDINDIQFISAEGDYTMIHTTSGRYLVSYSLKYWIDRLPAQKFSQVHKSYIVQISHIVKVAGNQIHLGDKQIPIGRTYKESFSIKFLNK